MFDLLFRTTAETKPDSIQVGSKMLLA